MSITMAVSSQWFYQWTQPTNYFSNIDHRFNKVRETSYKWDYFEPFRHKPVQVSVNSESLNEYNPGSLYGDELGAGNYLTRKLPDTDTPRINESTRLTGLALWMTMLGMARSQAVIADSETPPFSTLYKWKYIDFEFPTLEQRHEALSSKLYIPKNVIPLGIEVWGLRVFMTFPRWRNGVPATLATVPRPGGLTTPALKPYPNWDFHEIPYNCSGLISVFRITTDTCGRLWVLDSGQVDVQTTPRQVCPPSLVVFDLMKDELVERYTIPEKFVLQNSLFTNLVVDSRSYCSNVHVYIADTWRFGLVVFRQRDKQFWRFQHHLFFPDPLASNYNLHETNFRWTDGILGLALSPPKRARNRILYFHPLSSYYEFFVETSVLQNPDRVNNSENEFNIVGESRGRLGQASGSAIDRQGVMYFGSVSKDSIGCWDTAKPYNRKTMGVVAINTETLIFPNDVKIDRASKQVLWVLSNRLPIFQAKNLDPDDYNFRLLFVSTGEAMRGTICDPTIKLPLTSLQHNKL